MVPQDTNDALRDDFRFTVFQCDSRQVQLTSGEEQGPDLN
jgi:hypothetical protein